MEELKPCPFCGHPRSRLMHRTEYRENADGLTAEFDSYPGVWHEVKMLDFRHVFYRRCNKCGARGEYVKTDWHVRTEEETEDFTLCADQRSKLWGFDPDSEWARPWREQANEAWNRRADECDREALLSVCAEIEDADVDGCIDWADRIRKAIGEEQ